MPEQPQNMLDYALFHENINCVWFEQYYHQTCQKFRDVATLVKQDYPNAVRNVNEAYQYIVLNNGSRLYFKSFSAIQQVRGFLLSWVGFSSEINSVQREEVYTNIIRPAQVTLNGTVTLIAEHPLYLEDATLVSNK